MPEADPCLVAIEKFWASSLKAKNWVGCAEVLRFSVKYLLVGGQIPLEYNPTFKKRIGFLEKKLDSMTFLQSKKVIDAIAYARKRLNTSGDGPTRGGKFQAAISDSDRTRLTRALDTGFLSGLKRPLVAYTDASNDLDELRGHDRGVDFPGLE